MVGSDSGTVQPIGGALAREDVGGEEDEQVEGEGGRKARAAGQCEHRYSLSTST
jgi:hypothetical protein